MVRNGWGSHEEANSSVGDMKKIRGCGRELQLLNANHFGNV